jgi:hypothetical protein
MSVVGDLYELEPAVLDCDGGGGGASVKAVLDELLHWGRWPLDHLACCDAVHHRLLQLPDAGWLRDASGKAWRWVVDFHMPAPCLEAGKLPRGSGEDFFFGVY